MWGEHYVCLNPHSRISQPYYGSQLNLLKKSQCNSEKKIELHEITFYQMKLYLV